MIKSSDLLIFLWKTNSSGRSRSAISSTHLTTSNYHDTASPTIFQQNIHRIFDKIMTSSSKLRVAWSCKCGPIASVWRTTCFIAECPRSSSRLARADGPDRSRSTLFFSARIIISTEVACYAPSERTTIARF